VDVVVHLAADPRPSADFHESLLPANVIGVYNAFAAAAKAGCARLIFASSVRRRPLARSNPHAARRWSVAGERVPSRGPRMSGGWVIRCTPCSATRSTGPFLCL
jgi:hypothetical protein